MCCVAEEIYYKKVKGKYVPVGMYDSDVQSSLPIGSHLITVEPGWKMTRFRIDPAIAPLLAAGIYAEQGMIAALREISKLYPSVAPLTEEQHNAWEALIKSLDKDSVQLNRVSAQDIASAGVVALIEEASHLLMNPAVQKAYDNFMLVCKLVTEETND